MGLWKWLSDRLSAPKYRPEQRFVSNTQLPAEPEPEVLVPRGSWTLPLAEVHHPVAVPVTYAGLREIIFDLETTGLTSDDRIIEIAAIELVDRVPTGRTYQTLVNPDGRASHPKAEEQHGICSSQLAGQPRFTAVAPEFLAFVGGARLIAHNCFGFDQRMLNRELERAGRAPIPADRFRCTLEMARERFGGNGHSLNALCDRFAVDRSHRDAHRALVDCELLAAVYVRLDPEDSRPCLA